MKASRAGKMSRGVARRTTFDWGPGSSV